MKHVDVAIGVVIHESLVLICRRPANVALGGFWEFPGGKFEPGESAEDCLHRELREELGIEVEIDTPLPEIEHEYPEVHVRLYPFLCHWTGGEVQALGCERFQWVTPEALSEHEFPPANGPLIEYVQKALHAEAEAPHRDDELDALRIRQVARGRQATQRFASYCMIGALACGVAAIDLFWRAVRRFLLFGLVGRPLIYVAAAGALTWAAARFWGKSWHLAQEARRRKLPEPGAKPDFSTLSDGSQVVKNLEKLK